MPAERHGQAYIGQSVSMQYDAGALRGAVLTAAGSSRCGRRQRGTAASPSLLHGNVKNSCRRSLAQPSNHEPGPSAQRSCCNMAIYCRARLHGGHAAPPLSCAPRSTAGFCEWMLMLSYMAASMSQKAMVLSPTSACVCAHVLQDHDSERDGGRREDNQWVLLYLALPYEGKHSLICACSHAYS